MWWSPDPAAGAVPFSLIRSQAPILLYGKKVDLEDNIPAWKGKVNGYRNW
jgi:hypothetical protein